MRWRDYLRSLRAPLAFAIFARDDPLPALLDVPILAGIRLGRTREPDAWAPAQPGVASPGPLEAVS
jgi:predicted ATP-grasp superfamily ATP-dependent carboligase